jgi:hypothetical protein
MNQRDTETQRKTTQRNQSGGHTGAFCNARSALSCLYPPLCFLLCVPVSLWLALPGFSQDGLSPRFILHGKDGPLPPANIVRLCEDWAIETSAARGVLRPAADWAGLQQEGRARPAPPTENFVLLGNGDRLPLDLGRPVYLRDGRLLFTPAAPLRPLQGPELSLFAPHVAAILLAVPEGVDDVESYLAGLQQENRENDVVLLRGGDRIEGKVVGLDTKVGCAVVADGQKIQTPWPRLAGVAFASTGLARPRPKKTHALAVLAGGSRVRFTSLHFDSAQKGWVGRSSAGADMAITEQGLIALDLLRGQAVYLSELAPVRYAHTPYLGVRWPLGEDVSAAGRLLRVGDECYDKGIGLHGRCRVTYRLDGKYAWFEATAGLDPSAGSKGRARLAVLVDGKEHPLGDGKERTARDPPLAVLLDVRDARELTLVVDLGSLGDVQACVNWGGARLLK